MEDIKIDVQDIINSLANDIANEKVQNTMLKLQLDEAKKTMNKLNEELIKTRKELNNSKELKGEKK